MSTMTVSRTIEPRMARRSSYELPTGSGIGRLFRIGLAEKYEYSMEEDRAFLEREADKAELFRLLDALAG